MLHRLLYGRLVVAGVGVGALGSEEGDEFFSGEGGGLDEEGGWDWGGPFLFLLGT
jgi:hypothetical protein